MQTITALPAMRLGAGLDSNNLVVHNSPLRQFTEPTATKVTSQPERVALFQYVENTSALQSKLNISAEASIGFSLWGASAKGEFARNTKISKNSVNLLLYCSIVNSTQHIPYSDLVFSDQAAQLAQESESRFIDTFGTHVITGRQTGGEFFAIISIRANNRREQQKIKTEASASTFGFGANGDLNQRTREVFSNNNITVATSSSGGVLENHNSIERLVQQWREFPTTIAADGAAAPISYITMDFQSIAAVTPDVSDDEDTNRRLMSTTLRRLNDYANKLLDKLADLEFVRAHSELFKDATTVEINERIDRLQNELTKTRNLMQGWARGQTDEDGLDTDLSNFPDFEPIDPDLRFQTDIIDDINNILEVAEDENYDTLTPDSLSVAANQCRRISLFKEKQATNILMPERVKLWAKIEAGYQFFDGLPITFRRSIEERTDWLNSVLYLLKELQKGREFPENNGTVTLLLEKNLRTIQDTKAAYEALSLMVQDPRRWDYAEHIGHISPESLNSFSDINTSMRSLINELPSPVLAHN